MRRCGAARRGPSAHDYARGHPARQAPGRSRTSQRDAAPPALATAVHENAVTLQPEPRSSAPGAMRAPTFARNPKCKKNIRVQCPHRASCGDATSPNLITAPTAIRGTIRVISWLEPFRHGLLSRIQTLRGPDRGSGCSPIDGRIDHPAQNGDKQCYGEVASPLQRERAFFCLSRSLVSQLGSGGTAPCRHVHDPDRKGCNPGIRDRISPCAAIAGATSPSAAPPGILVTLEV